MDERNNIGMPNIEDELFGEIDGITEDDAVDFGDDAFTDLDELEGFSSSGGEAQPSSDVQVQEGNSDFDISDEDIDFGDMDILANDESEDDEVESATYPIDGPEDLEESTVFGNKELDIDDIELDSELIGAKPDEEDLEMKAVDDEIAKITEELGSDDVLSSMEKILESRDTHDEDYEDDDFDAGLVDSSILMEDDEIEDTSNYEIASRDNEFISPTGDIVVMEPTDSEDNFKLIYVDIENIAIVKRIRNNNNVDDLIKSIKSTGLLKPVDVAPTSADGVYVLLDGYRRILACARAGKRRIPCVVNTRVNVPEIPILEAMYNHSKKYSIKEMIDYIDYLEKQKGIMSASMIEYLLQMNSGEYTKLKDILNDNDDDIVSKLMDGIFTIEQAFKKLEQRRKKESAEVKDLKKATKVYEEDPESGAEMIEDSGETAEGEELSEAEIESLAINANNLHDVDEESLEDLVEASSNMDGFKPKKQDPKYRERLDQDVRKAILARDNNTCQICEHISGMEFTEVLDVHHIKEVYLGGDDDINNLITACTVCHKLIHLHARGELHMRPIEQMSEDEQMRFKRILKLGNKIRADMKVKGMKVDQLKKMDNASTIGRTKPGTGQEAG